ncbi:MAG: HAD family hydrolase [Chakrabartia sp.]
MDVSIFDLDRTLTKVATYTPFLIFAALHRAPWRLVLLPLWVVAMIAHALGAVSRKSLKEFGFLLMIGRRVKSDDMALLGQRFAAFMLARNILPAARRHLEAERKRGALLMLATAAPDYYAEALGRMLGFDVVVATRQHRAPQGHYTHRIEGDNCYGATKRLMVEAACHADPRLHAARQISFYSDSSSDAPMFDWAKRCFAVNPSRRLRKLAGERGWAILDFA